jgi:glycosyltransferase involved in cell wall biosynthesis
MTNKKLKMGQQSKILFIGSIQYNQVATAGGVENRNQCFLNFLLKKFNDVLWHDTFCKKHSNRFIESLLHRLNILIYLLKILFYYDRKIIISDRAKSAFFVINILFKLHIKRDLYLWIVGNETLMIKKGKYKCNYLNQLKSIIVQSQYIADNINDLGLKNIRVVPNFKNIDYIPIIPTTTTSKIKFIFFSTIQKFKGVDIAIEAAKQINIPDFEIDFYGSLRSPYSEKFFNELNMPNIKYKGFLNMQQNESYDILAGYDVMLFPTFFYDEGFPGVIIDAFIAGLPVIATNFQTNPSLIENGKNGLLFPTNNIEELKNAMSKFINKYYDLIEMRKYTQSLALEYDVNNVLCDKVLIELGFTL